MLSHSLSLEQIAHVIALATAPAFMLAGVVTFLFMLDARLARIIDRVRPREPVAATIGQADLQRSALSRRAAWLYGSMLLSILSGIITSQLIAIAFIGALAGFNTEIWIASLFILSLVAFAASLACLVGEMMVERRELRGL